MLVSDVKVKSRLKLKTELNFGMIGAIQHTRQDSVKLQLLVDILLLHLWVGWAVDLCVGGHDCGCALNGLSDVVGIMW